MLIATLFLVSACTNIVQRDCATGMFDKDGSCCETVCDITCDAGYEPGSCHCACLGDDTADSGIDDVFDEEGDVTPPGIPG